MDLKRAYEIVSALADGHNPYTGEVFNQDSVFQNADTAMALYTAREVLSIRITNGDRSKDLPENAGKIWEEAEILKLENEFAQDMSISDIAKAHNRTTWAIRQKLVKQGKIPF